VRRGVTSDSPPAIASSSIARLASTSLAFMVWLVPARAIWVHDERGQQLGRLDRRRLALGEGIVNGSSDRVVEVLGGRPVAWLARAAAFLTWEEPADHGGVYGGG
jgi:hypothetical protein